MDAQLKQKIKLRGPFQQKQKDLPKQGQGIMRRLFGKVLGRKEETKENWMGNYNSVLLDSKTQKSIPSLLTDVRDTSVSINYQKQNSYGSKLTSELLSKTKTNYDSSVPQKSAVE